MSTAPFLLCAGALATVRRLEFDFDLIDAHYFYPDGVAAVLLGAILKKPVIITARGTDINLIPKYRIPKRLIQFAATRAAALITVSQALKDGLIALGVPAGQITVLRNGVDLKLFHPGERQACRSSLGLTGKVLISVGHLVERKGNHIAISALPKLHEYTLLVVGSGPELSALRRLCETLQVADRVRFVGDLPHNQLPEYYKAADALILASSREGWPNVLLESMACGTPVIATPIWGNPEVVKDPAAGRLMTSRDSESLVEAVHALFADLPAREDTRKYAERFSWDVTSWGQVRLFDRVLADYKLSPVT